MAKTFARNADLAVGIDLGTTYSCLSFLTPQGKPETIPNAEGELSTPSVVLFDGDEVVVGTEALRHSVSNPERVVAFAKRSMGDPHKCWVMDGHVYRPKDISSFILKKLLQDAEPRLGKIRHAVITVPAQFSDAQREDTVAAGLQAGLESVDIINEPVAAAMCYVLGEGMWFAEIANDQTILVFDLGGGTFDLSLVKYNKNNVRVLATGGALRLGGLDWNRTLEEFACDEFIKESISDPRLDRESMQALAIEVEQAKRSLSVRPKSKLVVQHDGRRKSYTISRDQFEILTRPLVEKTETLTKELLQSHDLGWSVVDAVLVTGGASRMPMVRNMLQRISGTTLNDTLSPDQSICHGAAYHAGVLLSARQKEKSNLQEAVRDRLSNFEQQSVSGRSLGILVRDLETGERKPHYLIASGTPLPCAYRQRFGTVIPNQKRVQLQIVESGAAAEDPHVEIGECVIDGLRADLPVGSPIEVTIRYDEQARIRVSAIEQVSGQRANTVIHRGVTKPAPPEGKSPTPSAKSQPAEGLDPNRADTFQIVESDSDIVVVELPDPPKRPAVKPAPAPATPAVRSDVTSAGHKLAGSRPASPTPPGKPLQPAPASPSPSAGTPAGGQRPAPKKAGTPGAAPKRRKQQASKRTESRLEEADRPIPLCNHCGEVLDSKGRCPVCRTPKSLKSKRPTGRKGKEASREDEIPTELMESAPPRLQPNPAKIRRKS